MGFSDGFGRPSTPRDPRHGPDRGCALVLLVGLAVLAGFGDGVAQIVQVISCS